MDESMTCFSKFVFIVCLGTLCGAKTVIAADTTALNDKYGSEKTNLTQARGVLKAHQEATLAAGMSAKIVRAPYKTGQYFKKGGLLIQFDCARLKAESQALEQARNSAKFKFDNVSELLQAGAAGELELDIARSNYDKSNAEFRVLKARLKDCQIYAPYSGYVQKRHVNQYDTPALNAPLLSIIRAGKPDIRLIAPSSWLSWVKPGQDFTFTVDETGKSYPAKVVRTGASVDPVSQTISVSAKFRGAAAGALAGMSGVADFQGSETK